MKFTDRASMWLLLIWTQILHLGSALRLPGILDPASCPSDFKHHPLVILSLDGFRADYVEKGLTPTIEALARRGVKAPFIKPSYPSITFPNHYTIVTGLLPPYHGIVANSFFDPKFNATFRVGRKEFFERRWWGGEPIWKTAEKQGRIAATYFWPGSEVEGLRPTHWLRYNESHPFRVRVDQVLSWLDLPASRRPHLINFYLHEPDRQGHEFGPESFQVRNALRRVDDTVRHLLEGLERRGLLSCVNVMILADHGMAPAGRERLIHLQDHAPNVNKGTRFWNGVFPRFEPLDGSPAGTQALMDQLSCARPEMRVYHKQHLPARWHLGAQRRVEDIVLDLDAGYQADFDRTYKPDKGDHGYDNIFHVMNALFLAHGPAFQSGIEVESFQNVELYNLMCAVLGVTPAPNNGTWGALHHLLRTPPPVQDLTPIKNPPFASVPSKSFFKQRQLEKYLPDSEEDEDDEDDFMRLVPTLNDAESHLNALLEAHLPWGIPQHEKNPVKLLFHPDHITGYSEHLKAPIWVAFHLDSTDGGSTHEADWIGDVRIDARYLNTPQSQAPDGLVWEPLFHPGFSGRSVPAQIPYLSSNAVLVTPFLKQRWDQMRDLLMQWGRDYHGGVNVVMGTAFDYDYDTFADDLSTVRFSRSETLAPTHVFVVATRCLGGGAREGQDGLCPPQNLDVNAFILPQYIAVSNCMDAWSYLREFSAKVDDVEKIAGLRTFSHLRYEDQVRLRIRVHSNLWGRTVWQNRMRSDLFGLKKKK